MGENPLKSLTAYAGFVAELLERNTVARSTVVVWSDSPHTGTAEGEVVFTSGARLRVREEIDFDSGLITAYGYDVYLNEERLYWYDDFPHPNDAMLATSFPHHKHVPPDLKHHRVPAPSHRFDRPNLPILVGEIEELP